MTTNQLLQKGATMEFPLEEVARAIKKAVRLYMVSYFAFTFRKYSLYCTCVLQSCVCHDGGQLNNSFKNHIWLINVLLDMVSCVFLFNNSMNY